MFTDNKGIPIHPHKCSAFQHGIPALIIVDGVRHLGKYEGDNGIYFDLIEGDNLSDIEYWYELSSFTTMDEEIKNTIEHNAECERLGIDE